MQVPGPLSMRSETLPALVRDQIAAHPHRPCISNGEGHWMSFSEFGRKAAAFAAALERGGAKRGDLVAIHLPKGPEFVVAVLATWRLGACYVPIDIDAPQRHNAFVIKDSGVTLMLSAQSGQDLGFELGGCAVITVDEIDPNDTPSVSIETSPHDPAWILYTSGSTGKPKGVVGSHDATLNRCTWMWQSQPFTKDEVLVQNTGVTVVDSLWEVWGGIAAGLPVVVPPAATAKDLDALLRSLSANRITRICLVPSLLRALLATFPDIGSKIPRLHNWTCSGEPMDWSLADRFAKALPGRTLLNQYGLTESCADVTSFDVSSASVGQPRDAFVPIGEPIRGTEILILDRNNSPVPRGDVGELYLRGPAIAEGYVNAPHLTSEKFHRDPSTGVVALRTGDMVRQLPNGGIAYVGRADRQVQVRGFRVELESIEAVLNGLPWVSQAAVKVWDEEITAYLVLALPGSNPAFGEFRTALRTALPDHAIPTSFVVLNEFPTTQSGKILYAALRRPDREPAALSIPTLRDDVEERVFRFWRDELRLPVESVEDSFYELGGNSLGLMQLIAVANRMFSVRLRRESLGTEDLTIATFAERIRRAKVLERDIGIEHSTGVGRIYASEAQFAMWLHEQFSGAEGLYNIQNAFEIRGEFRSEGLRQALRSVISDQRALRVGLRFDGGRLLVADSENWLERLPFEEKRLSEHQFAEALRREGRRAFDLSQGPLIRVLLLSSVERRVLSITVHHTVCDGRSIGVLFRQLSDKYSEANGGTSVWPGTSEVSRIAIDVSRPGPPATSKPLQLPGASNVSAEARHMGESISFSIQREAVALVRDAARRVHTTPFVVAFSAFALALGRWASQETFSIGIPISESVAEADTTIGCFMRTVAVSIDIRPSESAAEYLQRISSTLSEGFQSRSSTDVGGGSTPSNVMFGWDQCYGDELRFSGAQTVYIPLPVQSVKLPISLLVEEGKEEWTARFEYAPVDVDELAVVDLRDQFARVLDDITGSLLEPERCVTEKTSVQGELSV